MDDLKNKHAILVGLFVIVGLSFLVVGILMVGNLHDTFKKKVKLVSLFEDVNGLQTGNNVWFSGVKVGTVSQLKFFDKSKVEVTIKIETNVMQYIHKDSKVKIGTDGLIGNKIIIIYGGTDNSSLVIAGDTLDVEKTFSSEDMINMLQENNKNLIAITTDFKSISHHLASGKGTISKLIYDEAIYSNLSNTTRILQNVSTKANLVANSLEKFTDGLNRHGTLGNKLANDTIVYGIIEHAAFKIKKMADTGSVLMSNLNRVSTNLKSPFGVIMNDEASGKQLKEILVNVNSGSKKLDEDLEAVQHNFLFRGFFKKKAKAKVESK
ncbi:MAG TPA: MlaD family protein [Saprospiraceae bacterium]|nr:MlaD family protein [Saprospiraceae bacterium]